jgi:hypothetical protein
MNKILLAILTSCVLIFLSGCSIQPKIPITYSKDAANVWPSNELKTRLLQYWTFRSSGNLEDSYKMEAPYIRELVSFSNYTSIFSKASAIEKIEVLRIESVNNKFYQIAIKIFYRMNDNSIKESFLMDGWVQTDKVWTHVKKDPILRDYFP